MKLIEKLKNLDGSDWLNIFAICFMVGYFITLIICLHP